MALVQISVDRVSNKGNPIAEESYEGKEIHVPDASEGDTVVVELSDRGSYVVGKIIKGYNEDDVLSIGNVNAIDNSNRDRSRGPNREPIARCPVKQCSAERFSRGMALHVYNSVGSGHGEYGKIPANITFDDPDRVDSGEVSVDYPINTGTTDDENSENISARIDEKAQTSHYEDDESFMYIGGWNENKSTVNRHSNLDREYAEFKDDLNVPSVWRNSN